MLKDGKRLATPNSKWIVIMFVMASIGPRPPASESFPAPFPLTERQLECLAWISEGKSSTDIGAILSISSRTVDYHVGEICQRLNVRTRMQAVAHAVRRGWLRD